MKRILPFFMFALLVSLACASTGVDIPVVIPSMDVAQVSTAIVQTADALATANGIYQMATGIAAATASPIPTDTPIVVTATDTATATPTSTPTASLTASATALPSATQIPPTNTQAVSQPTNAEASPTVVHQSPTEVQPVEEPAAEEVDCPSFNAAYESRVIELINAERAKAGLSALNPQGQLGSAARLHSADMACNNYFSHTGLDGSDVGSRTQNQGYGWSYVGENIAAGYSSPADVVKGWMKSPGHKANILGADYTEIGIGYAFGGESEYGSYWTAVFGSP